MTAPRVTHLVGHCDACGVAVDVPDARTGALFGADPWETWRAIGRVACEVCRQPVRARQVGAIRPRAERADHPALFGGVDGAGLWSE